MIETLATTPVRLQTFYTAEVYTDEFDYTIVEGPQEPLETLPMAVASIARHARTCIGVAVMTLITFAPSLVSNSVAATITAVPTPPVESLVDRVARVRERLNALPDRLEQMGLSGRLAVPTRETLDHAAEVFAALVTTGLQVPDIVPTPNGGVQFEWHTTVFDLEVDVSGPREVDVYLVDVKTGQRSDFVDLETIRDLEPVTSALKTIL